MYRSLKKITNKKGFTLIELLVVAAIIGILLAIAIPNLFKAIMSANEANARKAMQTLRDAEGEFFDQDLNNSGDRDFTDKIGTDSTDLNSLRCPSDPPGTQCTAADQLVDGSFTFADINGGNAGGNGTGDASSCLDPKAGYCLVADFSGINPLTTSVGTTFDDFGWEASMTSSNKSGRRDFSVYGNGVIKCTTTTKPVGSPGIFEATRSTSSSGCD